MLVRTVTIITDLTPQVSGDVTAMTQGSSYSVTLKGMGGKNSYTWSISSGKLPNGLKLAASTGKITGKFTKAGTFTFTVQLKDSNGTTAVKSFTMNVTKTEIGGTVPATGIIKKAIDYILNHAKKIDSIQIFDIYVFE